MEHNAEYYFRQADDRWHKANGSQDKNESMIHLDHAIQIDPDNLEYRKTRLRRNALRDNYPLMLEDSTKIIALSKELEDLKTAYRWRTVAYSYLDNLQGLLSDLGWLIDHGIGGSATYSHRGDTRLRAGLIDDALDDFDMAHKLQPENNDVLMQRAVAYYQVGRYVDCIDDLDAILRSPQNTQRYLEGVYFWKAKSYYKLNLLEYSIIEINKKRSLNGELPVRILPEDVLDK